MAEDITALLDVSASEDAPVDLTDKRLYINRELSWLGFNRRVLELSMDETMPLLERLKFLCISSTNLDEFFEVRVSSLKEQARAGSYQLGPDQITPSEQLAAISETVHDFVREQYRVLNDELFPALETAGIRFIKRTTWTKKQAAWVQSYFENFVFPVLSPLGLDPSHPFPRVLNKSLNFIVSLTGKDAFGRLAGVAVVQAPRSLPRVIRLPEGVSEGKNDFVFLSSIIHAHVGDLFPGMKIKGCHQFRVTRNSDLFVDEEEMQDLRIALEDELFTRNYGRGVRLEVADNCPDDMAQFLLEQFGLGQADLYQVNGPVNLNRLMTLSSEVDVPELKFPPFSPAIPAAFNRAADVFEAIRNGPVLLHHPYESFSPVVDFIRQSANDPDVLAIKMTVYRTDADSALTTALVDAARAGKEVTVVVELRARFDEERNIRISEKLQDAGAHVVYGVVGYKTHAKMALVVRREEDKIKRYAHVGTGNYHPRTSRLYTDFGMMTDDPLLCEDIHKMFMQLTGLGKTVALAKVKQSPFTLHDTLIQSIDREAAHAAAGKPAVIMAKMNSLTEPQVIRALYRASRAGVKVELIIRGICCLRPGVPGVSENITVRSIVGRFLEHSRAYYFENDGEPDYFIASADWMNRNLFRRVELCTPVERKALRKRIHRDAFEWGLADNTNVWILGVDGSYERLTPGDQPAFTSQHALLEAYT